MSVFPTRILLATDGSPDAERAARTAAELSEKLGSELHVVHVGEYRPTLYAQTEDEPARLRQNARELLDEQVRRVGETGGSVAEAHLRLGRAAEQIVNLSEELDAGVIVAGPRRPPPRRPWQRLQERRPPRALPGLRGAGRIGSRAPRQPGNRRVRIGGF